MIDSMGLYSLQIFKPDRQKFVSGNKNQASPEEYKSALLGASTHIGRIEINSANSQLLFHIDCALYPNWDNTTQVRNYKLMNDELYYEVPAQVAGGPIPVSVWKRVKQHS